jgi:hypothetical protein
MFSFFKILLCCFLILTGSLFVPIKDVSVFAQIDGRASDSLQFRVPYAFHNTFLSKSMA